jgi:hypothetical protein
VLLFVGDSPEVAERFAKANPYVTSGTVKRWRVREWKTVAGEAAMPVRPDSVATNKKMLSDSSNAVRGSSSGDKGLILRMWRAQPPRNQANMFGMQPAKFSRRFEQSQDIAEHTCSAVRLTAPSNLSY